MPLTYGHMMKSCLWNTRWRGGLALCLLWLFCFGLAAPGQANGQTAQSPKSPQPAGENRLVLSDKQLWAYAESLLRLGEYYRAISEYKRLRFFFPKSLLAQRAALRMGEAYLLGGEPGEAIALANRLLPENGKPAQGGESARQHSEQPASKALAPSLLAPMRFLRGVAWLELEELKPYPLREGHIAAALDDLRLLPKDWSGTTRIRGFVRAMDAPPDLPEKSPWLAGGMSALLPGLGSVYVGRYSEASLALFANAVFIYAAVDAKRKERHGLALVLGTAALTLYGGNIYAAANGAHKHNDLTRSGYLQQQRMHFGLVPRPGGWAGLVQGRF